MSIILDALNRSERDRRNDQVVPGIATAHYAQTAPGGRAWLTWALGAALLVAGAVIAWLLLARMSGSAAPGAAASEPASVIAPVAAPVVAPKASAGKASEASQASQPIATQDSRSIADTSSESRAVTGDMLSARTAENTPPPASDSAVQALYQQPGANDLSGEEGSASADSAAPAPSQPAVSAETAAPAPAVVSEVAARSSRVEEPLDIEAMVSRAQDELENARLAEHDAPFIASLSQSRKDQIPTLMYLRHDYSPDGATVTINGTTAKAGQAIGSGVRVDEILPDSVVLSHRGAQFRLRALNSWVNL